MKDYYTGYTPSSFARISELSQRVGFTFSNLELLDAAVFWATNVERTKNGLKPFSFHPKLRQMATLHSEQMRLHKFFSHENPYEARYKTMDNRLDAMKDSSFVGFRTYGENIAQYSTLNGPNQFSVVFRNGVPRFIAPDGSKILNCTCKEYAYNVVDGWMHSPGHRANILNPQFEYLGCGCAGFEKQGNSVPMLYYNLTQNFGGGIIPIPSKHIRYIFNPHATNSSNINKSNASLGDWRQKKQVIMASITLDFANTGEKLPVNDVDLESITNEELIDAAVANGGIKKPDEGMAYKVIGKDSTPVMDKATMASLGFVDGDTVKVVAKPAGA